MRRTLSYALSAAAVAWSVLWGAAYFDGKLLGAADFQQEQDYKRNALRFGPGGLAALLALLLVVNWTAVRRDDE